MKNKYEVIGVVGEGAYGIVYKCLNKENNQYVAIKKFKETSDPQVQKTMKRELKMLQNLKHENIVEFQEAFRHKNNLFLVFEFVEKNLLEVLEETKNGIDRKIIKKITYQIIKAIKYLHSNNIIHRDIKPENLLITSDYTVKLCDFGFARKNPFQNCNTNLNNIYMTDYVATRWYRSPELLLSQGIYGPEVDYWAVGCIMGELVDKNPLFPGDNEVDQIFCIMKVLGNLPESLIDLYYSNNIYNKNKLINVEKPETLEKKYLGKFSKVEIDFMKGLLEMDPKKRLNGDNVFKHKYFENYFIDENNKVFNNENNRESTSANNTQRKLNVRSNVIFNNNNYNNVNNEINEKESEKYKNKIINNTTNINIINYNNFNNNENNNNINENNINNNIYNNNNNSTNNSSINNIKLTVFPNINSNNSNSTSYNFNNNLISNNNNNNSKYSNKNSTSINFKQNNNNNKLINNTINYYDENFQLGNSTPNIISLISNEGYKTYFNNFNSIDENEEYNKNEMNNINKILNNMNINENNNNNNNINNNKLYNNLNKQMKKKKKFYDNKKYSNNNNINLSNYANEIFNKFNNNNNYNNYNYNNKYKPPIKKKIKLPHLNKNNFNKNNNNINLNLYINNKLNY